MRKESSERFGGPRTTWGLRETSRGKVNGKEKENENEKGRICKSRDVCPLFDTR
jgi:hypothetical protein